MSKVIGETKVEVKTKDVVTPELIADKQMVGTTLPLLEKSTLTTKTTAGAVTYSAAEILGKIIRRDPTGASRADLFPAATAIIAALPNFVAGMSFELTIINTADQAETITMTTNTGLTLVGTMTIAQGESKRFLVLINSSTAVAIYALQGSPVSSTDFGVTGIAADVIAESTATAGVTIDGLLLKDGGITAAILKGITTFVTAHAGLITGAGAEGATHPLGATAGKGLSFYLTSTASSGTSRGEYIRLYLPSGAGGEALRAYTTVSSDTPDDTVNGGHISLDFGASAGNVTGEGQAVRATLHLPASRTLNGTLAAVKAELFSDGSGSGISNASFLRCTAAGTGCGCVDDTGFFFSVDGLTANTGKLYRVAAPTSLAASLRVKVNGTTYYLPLYTAAA